jgi:hypothetical protein
MRDNVGRKVGKNQDHALSNWPPNLPPNDITSIRANSRAQAKNQSVANLRWQTLTETLGLIAIAIPPHATVPH